MTSSGRALAVFFLLAASFAGPREALAHPAPFSYLDLHLSARGVSGTLVVHDFDIARELQLDPAQPLDPKLSSRSRDTLVGILGSRLSLVLDGRPADLDWGALESLPERQSLRFSFSVAGERPGRVQ